MTDEEHEGIEEISVLSLLDRRFIETDDIDTLIQLQTAHDSWANPKFQQLHPASKAMRPLRAAGDRG